MTELSIRVGVVADPAPVLRELLRLLLRHPNVELCALQSRMPDSHDLRSIVRYFPEDSGIPKPSLTDIESISENCHAVFLCLPEGESAKIASDLVESGVHVFDLSTDYRFRHRESYSRVFQREHPTQEAQLQATYGLPELFRTQIRGAKLVALPGAIPTAVVLALAPLMKQDVLEPGRVIADCKTAASGLVSHPAAGPSFHDANENIMPWDVMNLRHKTEIEEQLLRLAGEKVNLTLVENLVPVDRGVLASCYAQLHEPLNSDDLTRLYEDFYGKESFVRVLGASPPPATKDVHLTNNCLLGVAVEDHQLVIHSALDNFGKGSAGQAIQSFNANYGIDEVIGITGGCKLHTTPEVTS